MKNRSAFKLIRGNRSQAEQRVGHVFGQDRVRGKSVLIDEARLAKVRRSLTRILTVSEDDIVRVTRAAPRQVRVFKTATSVEFGDNPADGKTVMEIVAADRPGLLSKVGRTFLAQEIDIAAAKIMTIGERAEDVFYICRRDGTPLDAQGQDRLRKSIIENLET